MLNDYKDIRDLIPFPPKWWDEMGCPRYCEFSPHEISNIYGKQCALLEIACQACGHIFQVAMSTTELDAVRGFTIKRFIEDKTIHYGDPPNIHCCASGPTMNCEDRRVLQFWEKGKNFNWKRFKKYEISLEN